jgi:hypothetical protein
MEPEGSVPNSQELSTCPYPEPEQSSGYMIGGLSSSSHLLLFIIGW